MNSKRYPFADLFEADLIVDAVYEGGSRGSTADDPIGRLLPVGNQGGFRYRGSPGKGTVRLCVLYSHHTDPDWPDTLDLELGRFTYYGDNKTPGRALHETVRSGNRILADAFDNLHQRVRGAIPPFLVFAKGAMGRDVVFRGLAVPGAPGISQTDDLVAVWRSRSGKRFQNYRAVFTILDTSVISRAWLTDICSGGSASPHGPPSWEEWRASGRYRALAAPRVREWRTAGEQLPQDQHGLALLESLVAYFKAHSEREYAFERVAAELFRLHSGGVVSYDLTRPWRDGGRDATGTFRIGAESSATSVSFALEAKCKTPTQNNSSGVRDTARLIARIRHRQFGVFVTTSCIHSQAYQEIIEDGHPIVVIAGGDIVRILTKHGLGDVTALHEWLAAGEPG